MSPSWWWHSCSAAGHGQGRAIEDNDAVLLIVVEALDGVAQSRDAPRELVEEVVEVASW
jgi:hypothetical protein